MKVSELFVMSAIILLAFALASRFINSSGVGIDIHLRDTAYVLPPLSICVAQATALCFFATIYSLWMLPFSRTAALWHFWFTTIGIGVFGCRYIEPAQPALTTEQRFWLSLCPRQLFFSRS